MLRSKLAAGTRCALEHGGAAPVIVDDGADLSVMIPKLIKGGFYHSGQVCVSVQRIFAPKAQAEQIAGLLAESAKKLVVGNAILETTDCGPLIRPREVERVATWIDEAKAAGATVLCGGAKLSDTTYAPTVLLNPPADAKVSTMEIFGPAVCVYGYDTIDEAVSAANSLPFAFQASVFTTHMATALRVGHALDASAVMVNEHTAFRTDWMPFAGRRQSGYGIGGIGYTMRDMCEEKMMVFAG
jgi:acyl-CoA reductase-like NAD-dependent aldehyde dehydrogenase